jgi:HD-GYP domain-containing protein (c-di-GMP phosphodiesterase class II)
VELHHERPDGSGYPYGLRRDEIPLLARIVHVADAYDALTSARAYRASVPQTDALAELWRFSGTQFDTAVVQALVAVLPRVQDQRVEPALHARDIEEHAVVVPFGRVSEVRLSS